MRGNGKIYNRQMTIWVFQQGGVSRFPRMRHWRFYTEFSASLRNFAAEALRLAAMVRTSMFFIDSGSASSCDARGTVANGRSKGLL